MTLRKLSAALATSAAVLSVLLSSTWAQADDALYAAKVKEVLEVGWGPSFRQLQPAAAAYSQAAQVSPRDARAPFALALVQIKHRRYDDAQASVAMALERDPNLFAAHQAEIFLTVLMKKHQAALPKLDRYAKLLSAEAAAGNASEEQLAAGARFLGQFIGYLATSAGEAPQLEVAAAQDQILKALPASAYESFEGARDAVDEKFTELFLDREQQQQVAQDAETQERIVIGQQLMADKQNLETERAGLEQARQASAQRLQAEEAQITAARGPLLERLSAVRRRMAPLEASMAQTDARISQYLSLAATERDPQKAFAYRLEADRLTAVMTRYQVDHATLRAQAAPLENELAVLDARRRAARDRYSAESSSIANRGVELVEGEKKLAARWEKNQRPVVGNTAAVSSRSALVKALTTYYSFPLEQERQNLLASFDK